MKFMLMMNAPGGTGDWQVANWPQEDFKAHIAFMKRLQQEAERMRASWWAPKAWRRRTQAKLVRAGKDGKPRSPTASFPEAKEFLAGYWIVDVESPERAYEIAAQASAAPGPGRRAAEHGDRGARR